MNKTIDLPRPERAAPADMNGPAGALLSPSCWIIESEPSTRQFLSLILNGFGIDTLEYAGDAELNKELAPRNPDLIVLNISEDSSDAIASLLRFVKSGYRGPVQLISSRGAAVLDYVTRIGVGHGLTMLPALTKPFDRQAVTKIVRDLKLGPAMSSSIQLDLDEAIKNSWVEFWYQPVVDLREKRLASIEAFARIRHPQHGIVLPAGFLANAPMSSIVKLSELATLAVLKAGLKFSKLGIDLPLAINMPIEALQKVPLEKLVGDFHTKPKDWPGLIVDVPHEQIANNLALAREFSKRLQRCNVNFAIDNFGHGELPGELPIFNVKELPFVQIKLNRHFPVDADKDSYAAHYRKMIGQAHKFGARTVAIGIEKAADALALLSIGCDYGQGYLLGQPMAQEQFVSLLRRRAGKRIESARPTAAPADFGTP